MMKETSLKQQEPTTAPTEDLSTPHFDELAIAVAQPVQPLPRRTRYAFSLPRVPRKAAVLGSAIVLLVGLSITAARQDDRAADPATDVQLQADSHPVMDEPAPEMTEKHAVAPRHDRRSAAQLARPRYADTIRIFIPADGKPAARKVGEIRN